ncbi:uncharacterized protein [Watersipora subatra]|uniref:uncharacterized protein n=1 Tax=Watersipora subatra TaxID=2589382 RepID=UPI00355B860F
MADMKEIVPPAIECGFCLRQGVALPNPHQLTCNHVHCLECLTGFYDENNILICPREDCNEVCEEPLNQLPAYDIAKDKPKSCDLCRKKGTDNEQAYSYCPLCDTIFCLKHHEFHQEYHEEFGKVHATINMEEYELLKSQQSRVCAEHTDKPVSMGCDKCLKMICLECVRKDKFCDDGETHQMMTLNQLVEQLADEINKLKKGMIEKEERLEQIFKFTSQKLAEYDQETTETLKQIHHKRDAQIKALESKYTQLEDEYTEDRLRTKTLITDFLENEILKKWSQIRNIMHKTECRGKHAHQTVFNLDNFNPSILILQCDIVSSYSDTKNNMQRLIDEIMPSVDVPSVSKVREKGDSCEIMIEVVFTDGFLMGEQQELRPSKALPKSLKLLHTVSLPSKPYSIRVWNSQILTGMYNKTVATIDNNYQVKGSFITFNNYPGAMEVYKDRLYTIVKGNPWTIYVHDQQGNQVTFWTHNDSCPYATGLAITCDKVVAPDRKNKLLMIYSLTGKKLKDISCPCLSQNDWVSLCVSERDKVVVSDYRSSQVFLIDITQDRLLWTCKDVTHPLGVARYGEKYILVGAFESSTVRTLDRSTGEVVSELTDDAIESCRVYDMDISGDRLIVANWNSEQHNLRSVLEVATQVELSKKFEVISSTSNQVQQPAKPVPRKEKWAFRLHTFKLRVKYEPGSKTLLTHCQGLLLGIHHRL